MSDLDNLTQCLQKKNQDGMIDLILSKDRDARVQLRSEYDEYAKSQNKKVLADEIKSKFGGDFKSVVGKLFFSRAEYDADLLTKAFKGFSIEEDPIYEVIFNRPKDMLDEAKDIYKQRNDRTLESDVQKHFPNPIKKNLLKILGTKRNPDGTPDHNTCKNEAENLVRLDPDDWLANDKVVNMLATSSPQELVLISRYYLKLKGTHIMDSMSKMSKSHRKFIQTLFFCLISPAEYFASKINEAIKGLGTDTNLLERVLVTRFDVDMTLIKRYYRQNYNTSAKLDIEDDTSGSYKKLLIGLINQIDPEEY